MEPVTMAAVQVAKSEAGKKAIKAGCLVAAGAILLPFFMFLALLGALVGWAVNGTPGSADGCIPKSDFGNASGAEVAMLVLKGEGVTDKGQLIVMTAIAGAESGWNPKAVNPNGGASGLWQIYPPAHPQYFPPVKPADWIFDPANNASAAVPIAGGKSIPNLYPWVTDRAVKAWSAAGGKLNPAGPWSLADTVDDSSGDFDTARKAYDSVGTSGSSGSGADCSTGGNASTQAIEAEADKLDKAGLPYCFGGGHTQPAKPTFGFSRYTECGPPSNPGCCPGLDCSGAVSYVLQHAGVNVTTRVSGGFMNWGDPAKPGDPGVLVWAADGHVFMTVNGRIFSSNNWWTSTGGPSWRGTDVAAAEPKESSGPYYGYVVRHVPGTS